MTTGLGIIVTLCGVLLVHRVISLPPRVARGARPAPVGWTVALAGACLLAAGVLQRVE